MFRSSMGVNTVYPSIIHSISSDYSVDTVIEHINGLIDSLALDHKRGASEIVGDIVDLFDLIAVYGVENPAESEQLFRRAVRRLAKGQPTMASVLNMLNETCMAYVSTDGNWNDFRKEVSKIDEHQKRVVTMMQDRSAELEPIPEVLLTFSNSSNVFQMIAKCVQKGLPKRVICGESRPIMEGVLMARKITSLGVDVTLYTDAALFSNITSVDAVWIGGDAFSSNGLVNKAGSHALAILAKSVGIPFYSIISSDKFLSPQLEPYFRFLPQNPREINASETEGYKVVNEYYELIPIGLVTRVFTEYGLLEPESLTKKIQDNPVSPLFVELVR